MCEVEQINSNLETSNSNVYIILLNYNSWEDTNYCIDSLLEMDTQNFRIIICDNASSNDSLNKIHTKILQLHEANGIDYTCYENNITSHQLMYIDGSVKSDARITLINNNENKGFSAGNNIGIQYALQDCNCQYIWLLNNDTEVHPHALSAFFNMFNNDRRLMMSSSVCCEFNEREKVQCIGGYINRWTFQTSGVGQGISYQDIHQVDLRTISILAGPSVMIRAQYFHKANTYLDERYNFYFEEADLAKNIRDMGYDIRPCLDSVVYHRGGHSTSKKGMNFVAYHLTRSKLLFVNKFYPSRIYYVILYTLAKTIFFCLKGNISIAMATLRGMYDALNHTRIKGKIKR